MPWAARTCSIAAVRTACSYSGSEEKNRSNVAPSYSIDQVVKVLLRVVPRDEPSDPGATGLTDSPAQPQINFRPTGGSPCGGPAPRRSRYARVSRLLAAVDSLLSAGWKVQLMFFESSSPE